MSSQAARRIAAGFGFLAVALGAFGAHSLHARLLERGTVELWEKAVLYHLAHTLVLLWLSGRSRLATGPFVSFALGISLFSGSLYLYALTKVGWLVALTPFGGLALLTGWLWLALRRAE